MLDGVRVHVIPAGETEAVRLTVPVKPLTGATVMVEVPDAPATIVTEVGLAMTEKSGTATLNVTVAAWDSVPLVPVTVTVKSPLADDVQESVDVPDPVTLVGVRVHVRPVVGEIVAVRLTTPPNPLRAATVMVELLVPPTFIVLLVG